MKKQADPQISESLPNAWWSRPAEESLEAFGVDPNRGLSQSQIEQNRQKYGSNQLEDTGPTSLWTLLWESVKTPMMILLLIIAGISLVLGQIREAVVMVYVVTMCVGVHLLNKACADRTMARLREVQVPKAFVVRDGKQQEIDFEAVVVGDILPCISIRLHGVDL